MKKIEVEILSLEGEIFKGKTESLEFCTPKGEIQILPDHCEGFFLIEGEIRVFSQKFFTKKGVCFFSENRAIILIQK
jgi:F0F1-type ATP synthase epsilon subunit